MRKQAEKLRDNFNAEDFKPQDFKIDPKQMDELKQQMNQLKRQTEEMKTQGFGNHV